MCSRWCAVARCTATRPPTTCGSTPGTASRASWGTARRPAPAVIRRATSPPGSRARARRLRHRTRPRDLTDDRGPGRRLCDVGDRTAATGSCTSRPRRWSGASAETRASTRPGHRSVLDPVGRVAGVAPTARGRARRHSGAGRPRDLRPDRRRRRGQECRIPALGPSVELSADGSFLLAPGTTMPTTLSTGQPSWTCAVERGGTCRAGTTGTPGSPGHTATSPSCSSTGDGQGAPACLPCGHPRVRRVALPGPRSAADVLAGQRRGD